jgi:signal transduction histidine kinase
MLYARDGVEDQLSRLCHDLRQYVVTGLLISDVAHDGDPGSEAAVRLATLHTVFEQLRLIIDAETDDARIRATAIDLPQAVADCVLIAEKRGIAIRKSLAPRAMAYGDPVLLRRAVANVLDNAARAAGEGGTIEVRVLAAGHDSIIEVTDDGVGFGRGPHGSGHGMSVVAMAVEACGGRLEISSSPADGTTVRMVLPRHGATR